MDLLRLSQYRSAVRGLSMSGAFAEDFTRNHVQLSFLQRMVLSAGAAAISLANPYRADMIACLGETTGQSALVHCLQQMQSSTEGRRILDQRPRINSSTIDLASLKRLPNGTLGKSYYNFLETNEVTPDSRMAVKFVDDIELAYVMQRYREVHDIYHTALSMPTTMLGEVAVKWVEAVQTRLPMCTSGAIFGAMRLRPKSRKMYTDHYLPWALRTGSQSQFLLGVYFEERWEQPLTEFYKEMNIVPLVI
ncbi:ubiquinone biosynthesis protein COQ4 homolog, mitochondrial [Neodiprion pinetum]|uniref:Ubiquinone biosynthesis protein COQ4 homolog, mitochondrial n=1 Tax=Neodiprion lecontei TaxID=441921 RepID=A0A6J0CAY8_NEOLC|nr:ubiquinone biosynthesis protein COQ4 homolog, mitochondrial [Neodiprion lecontei]XP_046467409.1 ubiquinone biosynthesis protein COQ4 homolog, mitochondrial [Neodiprion pinetum]